MNLKRLLPLTLLIILFALTLSGLLVSCGKQANIDYIEVYNSPKLSYLEGEELDLSNAQIRIVFKNNTEKIIPVTADMVSGYDPHILGKQYLKIFYEDRSASLEISVSKYSVRSAAVVIPSANATLVQDQNLNLENAFVDIKLINGDSATVFITEEMCEGFDRNKIGKQTITVNFTYGGQAQQVKFVVSVIEKELIGIEVTQKPVKNIYYVGESELSLVGGKIFLKYNSGYSTEISMTDSQGHSIIGLYHNWNNISISDNSSVEIIYSGFSANFDIQVKLRDVLFCRFIQPPVDQMQNIPLNLNGSVIEITYNNNEKEIIALPNSKVAISGFDETMAGVQTAQIVFTYADVQMQTKGTIQLNVIQREEHSIEIVRPNIPLFQDTLIETDSWEYRIIYNNGEISENMPFSSSMVVWDDGEEITSYSQPGNYSWRIQKSADVEIFYEIQILPLVLYEDSIEFIDIDGNPIDSVNVFIGDDFDATGIYLRVTYSNGKTRTPNEGLPGIPLLPESVSFDNLVEGIKVANVNYSDNYIVNHQTSLYVNVINRIVSVSLSASPNFQYVKNEIFDPSGLVLTVNYEHGGSSAQLSYQDAEFQQKGWSLSCEWFDEDNRFTKTDGEIVGGETINVVVYLNNPGLISPFVLDVNVTNDFVDFSENPFFAKVSNGGIEYFQPVENLGTVLPGKPVDFGRYFIELRYQSETVMREITADMVLDLDINNTILSRRNIIVYYPKVPTSPEEENTPSRMTYVEVEEVSITGIEIMEFPFKLYYYKVSGGSVPLDSSGIILHVLYDNDTRKTVDTNQAMEDDRLLFAGFNSGDVGIQTIAVTYYDEYETRWETTFDVEVLESELSSILWEGLDSLVYWKEHNGVQIPSTTKREGESFDLYNLSTSAITIDEVEYYSRPFLNLFVIKLFTDGHSETVSYEEIYQDLDIYDYNKDSSITQYARLVYRYSEDANIYLSIQVKMLKSIIKAIYITDDSPTFVAVQGDNIVLSGIKLGLEFETDGQIDVDKFVPMISSYIVKSLQNPGGYEKTDRTVGIRLATILYTFDGITKTCEVQVLVTEKHLVRIELSEIPKQFYIEGENFDPSTGSITAYFNNSETETRFFSEAVINVQGLFSISTLNFNSSEFSGYDKVQRIFVSYASDYLMSDIQTLGFNIIMRDRKQVEARFSSLNRYTFIYGNTVAPQLELWGYDAYGSTVRNYSFTPESYKVEYIEQNVWITQSMGSVDYTQLPTHAGIYFIVVTYDGGLVNNFNGDSLHNKYQNADYKLTINKKNLYFSFWPGQNKTYGTENPDILLVLKAVKSDNILIDPLSLFAYEDDFYSSNFNPSLDTYPSTCYLVDSQGNKFVNPKTGFPVLLNMFDFKIMRAGGETLTESSAAGSYSIGFTVNKIASLNYNIVFEDSVFIVERRQVKVIANSLSYIYGNPMPIITYSTSKVTDSEDVVIEDSGLYGADILSGQLNRLTPNIDNVGSYLVTRGNIGVTNLNYIVIFENSAQSIDPKYVNILPRNIYVRADSRVKVYGELFSQPTVQYFSDSLCTMTEGVFALGDVPEDLGILSFEHQINYISVVGKYDVYPVITPTLGSSLNYNIICSNGVVVIEKRPVKVLPSAVNKVYGQDDPQTFAYSISALQDIYISGPVVLRDEFGNPRMEEGLPICQSLNGNLVRDIGEDVGSYQIRKGNLAAQNPNYTIVYISAYLNINKKDLFVAINPESLSKIYDGRKPLINTDSLIVMEYMEGEYVVYSQYLEILSFIQVSCPSASKNVGDYTVQLTSTNPNYNIALNNSYIFTISPKTIRVQYDSLPANQQYKATPFIISASVDREDLQYQYNEDRTIKTDQYNQPMYDSVTVYLSLSSVTNAGNYSTKVDSISDPMNYNLSLENNPLINFSILPRVISIAINANSPDGFTFSKEYDGFEATFKTSDYSLSNLISGYTDPLPLFELGVYVSQGSQPSDVKFDINGNVISYNVAITQNSDDSNFIYQLSKPYLYKITPKTARINIIEQYLTKSYDENLPTITSGMYSFSESANINKEDIIFTYTRITGNDGRSNRDAGEYGISVDCLDKNFRVNLAQNYFYTINKKEIKLVIAQSARERQYNGEQVSFAKSVLSVSTGSASIPKVRNFLNNGDFGRFQADFGFIKSTSNQLRVAIDKIIINADTIPFTLTNIDAAKTSLNTARARLNSYGAVLEVESHSVINAAYIAIEDKLTAIQNSLNGGSLDLAEGYLELTKSYMAMAFTKITYENTYLAFEFGEENAVAVVNAGIYPYIFTSNDYNIVFDLNYPLDNRVVEIQPKLVLIEIQDVHIRYGNPVLETEHNTYVDYSYYMPGNGIGYKILDVKTGLYINIATITGFPRPIEDLIKVSPVGSYRMYLKNPNTLEVYMSETSGNYTLATTSNSSFYIDKALLTIRLENHGENQPIVYGTSLEMFAVQGYDYLDFNSSTYLEDESLWSAAGVTGADDPNLREKLNETYGGVVAPHTFSSEIVDSSVVYNCYINPQNPALGEIFNRVVNVSTYQVNASGFSTNSQCYEIQVLPGNVKISRKPLQPKFLAGGSYLTRTYGNSYVDLSFDGILDQDLFGFSSLPAFTISPEGILVNINCTVGSSEFSAILLNGDDPTYNENASALDPQKPYNSSYVEVNFDNEVYNQPGYEYVLSNYSFAFTGGYELRINKRPVTLKVESGSGSNIINTVYGSGAQPSSIDYQITYGNLASHDSAAALKINKGGDFEPDIDFIQNAGSTTLNDTKVVFPYAVLNDQLMNYEFTVLESTLSVAKKPINVFVRSPYLNENNQLPVMYERYLDLSTISYNYDYISGTDRMNFNAANTLGDVLPGIVLRGYQISPYIARYDGGSEAASLVYGQYGFNDFYALSPSDVLNKYVTTDRISGFAYGETFANVFAKGYLGGTGAEKSSLGLDEPDIFYFPLDATLIPIHSIDIIPPDYASLLGTYKLKNLTFQGGVENYTITYEPMDYKLVTQVGKMMPAKNQVILSSDKPDFADLIKVDSFRIDFIAGTISTSAETLTYLDSPYLNKTAGDESTFINNNQNYYLDFGYGEKYALFKKLDSYEISYVGNTLIMEEKRGSFNAIDPSVVELSNRNIETRVAIRIYDKSTVTGYASYNDLNNDPLPYCLHEFIPSTYLSGPNGAPSSILYDRIEVAIRLVVPNKSLEYKTSILINGSYSTGTYLALEFRKGYTGKAYIVRYDADVLMGQLEINLRGAKPFDGFTHDVRIVFDKRIGSVIVSYDYIAGQMVYVQDIGVILAGIGDHVISEQSELGFRLTGVNAYLRYFTYSNQGYYDNYATKIQRVNVNLDGLYGNGDHDLHIVLNSNKSLSATVDLRTLFSPYMPNIAGQRFEYYVNGTLNQSLEYGDLIPNPPGLMFNLTLYPGLNKIEVYVYYDDGISAEVLVCSEIATALVDQEPYSFKLVRNSGETTPVSIDGGTMKFYTPKDDPAEQVDPSSPEMSKYILTQYGEAASGALNSPLVRSVEYSMTFAEAKYYNGEPDLAYYTGESKYSFNLFMEGATYAVDDGSGTTRGLSFILTRNRTEQNAYSYSAKLVVANRLTGAQHSPKQFDIPFNELAAIDFDDNAIYTFGFFLDRDDINNYEGSGVDRRTGDGGMLIRILRNGAPIFIKYIDTKYALDNASSPITLTDPTYDIFSPIWLTPAAGQANGISIGASKNFRNILYDITVNKNSHTNSDYLVDNVYMQKNVPSGNVLSATGTELSLMHSDGYGNQLVSRFENAVLSYTADSVGALPGWEWHMVANEAIAAGYDNFYNKGMKLVYNNDTNTLDFVFYHDGMDYLAQPIVIPVGGLLDTSIKHVIRVEYDRQRYSTGSSTSYNVMAGDLALTDSSGAGLPIHYGKAFVYVDDIPVQEVFFPYYNSTESWYRPLLDINYGTTYQGIITGIDGEKAYGNYPQFFNYYNQGEFILQDAEILLHDYSSHNGLYSAEYRGLVNGLPPVI